MILLNYILLKEYINKLTIDKLNELATNNNIFLNNRETKILYKYIKERYLDFIKNPNEIINELKEEITPNNYNKLLNIYNIYKEKIRKYFP